MKCKGCGAEIFWVKTMKGKSMPVDLAEWSWSESDGNITLVTGDGRIITKPKAGDSGYLPHWASCPKAKTFKK